MKNYIIIILIQFLIIQNSIAQDSCTDPKDLVKDLYKNYSPLEVKSKDITSQDIYTLKKYFTQSLVKLIDKNNKCELKNNGICKLDYDILTNSQDTDDTKIIFLNNQNLNNVNVMITFHSFNNFIKFKFKKESGCYLIDDINYGKDSSLVKTLR